jgi:hypothetical protein
MMIDGTPDSIPLPATDIPLLALPDSVLPAGARIPTLDDVVRPELSPVNEHLDGKVLGVDGSLNDPIASLLTAEDFHRALVDAAAKQSVEPLLVAQAIQSGVIPSAELRIALGLTEPPVIFEDMRLQEQLDALNWGRLDWTFEQFWEAAQ